MYAEPNWGMNNITRHRDCPFRTKLANCDAVGGFCTSVNETICEGIHRALDMNTRGKGKWIRNDNGAYSCSLCQSWISVNERLPEYGQHVLASVHEDYAEHEIIVNIYKEQPFWNNGIITAWMPLPEPYKGE